MGEVLQVYRTPDADLPTAPVGVQNAPGETLATTIGEAVTGTVGLGEGLDDVDALGDGAGV